MNELLEESVRKHGNMTPGHYLLYHSTEIKTSVGADLDSGCPLLSYRLEQQLELMTSGIVWTSVWVELCSGHVETTFIEWETQQGDCRSLLIGPLDNISGERWKKVVHDMLEIHLGPPDTEFQYFDQRGAVQARRSFLNPSGRID